MAALLSQSPDDERNLFLGNFQVLPVRPKALGVKILERLPGQFQAPLSVTLRCRFHVGNIRRGAFGGNQTLIFRYELLMTPLCVMAQVPLSRITFHVFTFHAFTHHVSVAPARSVEDIRPLFRVSTMPP